MNEIFPQGHAWIDGNFVELSEAKIPILDWGFLRSDATFDLSFKVKTGVSMPIPEQSSAPHFTNLAANPFQVIFTAE